VDFEFIGKVVLYISGDTDINYQFPRIKSIDSSDLKGFTKQESNINGVDFEWIKQQGDADWGFAGTLAIEIPLSDGHYIFIDYCD